MYANPNVTVFSLSCDRYRGDNTSRTLCHTPGDKIHIPLKTNEALRLDLHVKPTKDMPRLGAAKKARKKSTKKRKPEPA
jgi:hypothetical protein